MAARGGRWAPPPGGRLNPAYLIATMGSVFYGCADFCGGMAARRSSALAVTLIAGFSALGILLIGMPMAPGETRVSDLWWGIAGGTFGAFGAMLVYRALAIGPMSVASPIFSVVGLALPVVVGVAFGERPSWLALGGLALAPLSIVLLAQGPHPEHAPHSGHPADPRRAVVPSLVAGSVLGFFLVFLGRIEGGASLWPLAAARTAGILCLAVVLLARRQPLLPAPADRGLALLAGALDSLANLAYVAAVPRASMSLVAALVSLAPATSVLLARWVLSERWSVPQRAGLVAALVAGLCISLG